MPLPVQSLGAQAPMSVYVVVGSDVIEASIRHVREPKKRSGADTLDALALLFLMGELEYTSTADLARSTLRKLCGTRKTETMREDERFSTTLCASQSAG